MIFSIVHNTDYRYQQPVFLEPHTLRLRPKTDGMQQLLNFSIDIDPKPEGLTECRDLDGNMEHVVWFNDLTDHLHIKVTSKVATLCDNPFSFLVEPTALRIPFNTDKIYRPGIKPYLSNEIEPEVRRFAEELATEAGQETLTFLNLLSTRLYSTCEVVVREEGLPASPSHTLNERRGACRDLAWLFIAACRSQGIGARFVSGYQEGDPEGEHHLHAWAEVYLPLAGWRGYDPTLGLAVADRHVLLAAGPRPDSAAPVTGTFRGQGKATLQSTIKMTVTPT